jgi:hypothetical protein
MHAKGFGLNGLIVARIRCPARSSPMIAGLGLVRVRNKGRPSRSRGYVRLDGWMRLHSVKVPLDVGEVVLEVCPRIDDGGVTHREDVVQCEIGVGENVGAEKEILALEDRVKSLLHDKIEWVTQTP